MRGHAWAVCLMMLSGPICPSEWFEFTGPRQSNCPNHKVNRYFPKLSGHTRRRNGLEQAGVGLKRRERERDDTLLLIVVFLFIPVYKHSQ